VSLTPSSTTAEFLSGRNCGPSSHALLRASYRTAASFARPLQITFNCCSNVSIDQGIILSLCAWTWVYIMFIRMVHLSIQIEWWRSECFIPALTCFHVFHYCPRADILSQHILSSMVANWNCLATAPISVCNAMRPISSPLYEPAWVRFHERSLTGAALL
jgi:hypothetical protein